MLAAAKESQIRRMVMSTVKMQWLAGLLVVLALAPVATVSAATYTDDFNRTDSSTLGANWSNAFGWTGYGISSNTAAQANIDLAGASYYSAAPIISAPHVITSVEFQASLNVNNPGVPTMRFGITDSTGTSEWSGCVMYVQGLVGCKFAVDGDWRDTTSAVTLADGTWYRMTVEQTGADFKGTLSTLGGTTLIEHTYTSLVQTSANGYAFIGKGALWGLGIDYGSPVYDNFSLTVGPVPEPASLGLLVAGALGLVSARSRRRN
jgi:hypothetical protein